MSFKGSGFLSPAFFQRNERVVVVIALAFFLGFNLLTAAFSPDPWLDEISYSEPAVTLATTGHMASHAWGKQGEPVWTGNAPLHQLLLAGVIKVFGFHYWTVRGVSVLYYSIAVLLIYEIVRKHQLIQKTRNRLLLVLVLLMGTGLVALYRNGRYDAIGTVLVVFWAWCSLQSRQRPVFLAGVFLSAILMPTASLNIAPFLVLCGLAALCLWGWKSVYALGVTGVGCLAGMGIMEVTYAHFGVPHIFHEIMKSSGGRNVVADFIQSMFLNPSYVAGVAGGCLLYFVLRRESFQKDSFRKKIALALFCIAIALPLLMMAVAKYDIYYTWMAIIPASICAFTVLEFQSVPGLFRALELGLILIATLPGFPRRCIRIAGSWAQDRPGQVAAGVRKNVLKTDVAFVNEGAAIVYYALLPSVREAYWLDVPTDADVKASVNVVFWPDAGREKELHDIFGGEWRQVAFEELGHDKLELIKAESAHFAIYRRT